MTGHSSYPGRGNPTLTEDAEWRLACPILDLGPNARRKAGPCVDSPHEFLEA